MLRSGFLGGALCVTTLRSYMTQGGRVTTPPGRVTPWGHMTTPRGHTTPGVIRPLGVVTRPRRSYDASRGPVTPGVT